MKNDTNSIVFDEEKIQNIFYSFFSFHGNKNVLSRWGTIG